MKFILFFCSIFVCSIDILRFLFRQKARLRCGGAPKNLVVYEDVLIRRNAKDEYCSCKERVEWCEYLGTARPSARSVESERERCTASVRVYSLTQRRAKTEHKGFNTPPLGAGKVSEANTKWVQSLPCVVIPFIPILPRNRFMQLWHVHNF